MTNEIVQDQSTNNLHYRGADREDGTPTALCNKRFRVFTYASAESQAMFAEDWDRYLACPRCEAKAAKPKPMGKFDRLRAGDKRARR